MFSCPHCERRGIPALRKALLSPGLPATCRSCRGRSGIRYPAWLLAMLPGSLLMVAALFVEPGLLEWVLNVSGFTLMIAIPWLFTSLHME